MNWQEVCEHTSLKDLPFKIELDELGRIIMSPVKLYHSFFQVKIAKLLEQFLNNGVALSKCVIKTKGGTKVADVAWVSLPKWAKIKHETEVSIAPEICVEIISTSNSPKEMSEKRKLYFETGAKEVWLCDEQGNMSFFNHQQQLKQSELVTEFPEKIDI